MNSKIRVVFSRKEENGLPEQIDIPYTTLTDIFIDKEDEKEKGVSFILNKTDEEFYSYDSILRKAKKLLGFLQNKGLKPKDHVVLQLANNKEFILTFWACVLGGMIPVPIIAEEVDEHRRKLFNVLKTLEDAFVIGRSTSLKKIEDFAYRKGQDVQLIQNSYLEIEEAIAYAHDGDIYTETKPEDIAFIQFSSGSTGAPKGVVLTHQNLLTNMDAIISGAQITEDDVLVSWMPLTHDMGLIGCHLTVTCMNVMQYSMNPLLFVRRPALWLKKIDEHKATIISSPNFGLEYSMKAMDRHQEQFDFSSVRIIINGAEPISVSICEQFLQRTSVFGMNPNAMFPVYGMAEASLAIAFPLIDEQMNSVIVDRSKLKVGDRVQYLQDHEKENASSYADEGFAVKNCEIRICDDEDNLLDEDRLGLIQIKGPNVTPGYYRNPEVNEKQFTEDGWLRTGDLGFFHQKRLIVVGREKEMIILNGQNYFPNDLEQVAGELESIDENKIAMISAHVKGTSSEKVVAFVVHKGDIDTFIPLSLQLRSHISRSCGVTLDEIVPVAKIPKTSSGKPMRFKLRDEFENGEFNEVLKQCSLLAGQEQHDAKGKYNEDSGKNNRQDVAKEILRICRDVSPDLNLGLTDHFFDYGVNSLLLNQIAARIEEVYAVDLPGEIFFKYPSVNQVAAYICGEEKPIQVNAPRDHIDGAKDQAEIAIIGMAATVPGALDISEFFGNLCGGVESVGSIPPKRRADIEAYLNSAQVEGEVDPQNAGYLYEIDKFDYHFFKILKKEAIAMSPAQRLFLQTAYSSLEDAGYGGTALKSSNTGVYVGYLADVNGHQYQDILRQSADSQTATGLLSSNISGRVSYFMDFKGPSMNIDSACSSSMVALQHACTALRNGDCDQAIVGGVEIKTVPIKKEKRVGFESTDGHTRPFADEGDGTGEGEGVVSILIKPYKKAIEDNDNIYSVIRGIGVNQDGYSVGISAPNPAAQTELVHHTLEKTGLRAEDISYIEAHGTGTQLGDPVEMTALTDAFRLTTNKKQFCSIGSVKSNIGHLFAASGLASIVKTSLMLKHKKIPATINIENLHRNINFEETPFWVNRQYKDWQVETAPRRAGVSNFGFSGTNAHVILEEYIDSREKKQEEKAFPIIFSAHSLQELEDILKKYHLFFTNQKELDIADVSYTLARGRGHYPYRMAFIVRNLAELVEKLDRYQYTTNLQDKRYVGLVKMVNGLNANQSWRDITTEEQQYLQQITSNLLDSFQQQSEKNREALLEKICNLYVRGADPQWEALFEKETFKRVSLPIYPFRATRCWPETNDLVKG